MTQVYFHCEDRTVTTQLEVSGQSSKQDIKASPHIVSDILGGIESMLAAHRLTPADISKSQKTGELRGSSADRAVSVVSEMLNMAG